MATLENAELGALYCCVIRNGAGDDCFGELVYVVNGEADRILITAHQPRHLGSGAIVSEKKIYEMTADEYIAHEAGRVPVTAQFAWDNLCDEPLWVLLTEEIEYLRGDPWLEITGMDRETRGEKRFILEHGRTGEMFVAPDFIVYAQKRKVQS